MKSRNRKKQFVDPEVQGALAKRLGLQWCVFLLVATLLVFSLQWMSDPFAPLDQTFSQAWWTYGPLLLVLLCLAPVFIYDAVKLSNRFTGPIHRLRQATRSLAEGQTPQRVEFRGADFWQDLADDFNRVVDRVEASESNAAEANRSE